MYVEERAGVVGLNSQFKPPLESLELIAVSKGL